MNWTDVYGEESSPVAAAAPISASGPYQSFVAPAFSGAMTGGSGGPAPAFSLVGLILLVVAWRVIVQMSED